MTAVGGFFGLERQQGAGVWHAGGLALTSGRACLRAILELTRPSRVLVPFYICDAALAPLRLLNIPFEFYGLTQALDPDAGDWPAHAAVVVVNYFDLKGPTAQRAARELGERAIVDDTQAFFRRGRGRSWSFNSARKFFGVPDGAYVYGPGINGVHPGAPNDAAPSDHLRTRLEGQQELAYAQYLAAESRVSLEAFAPSGLSTRLLAGIDYADVREARRRNFSLLHERLAASNRLPLDLSLEADAVPFCYPFLPEQPSLHQRLWQREIYVPRLWPEVATRAAQGFVWERDLSSRLLPLPIDQRYGESDMLRVSEAVLEVAA